MKNKTKHRKCINMYKNNKDKQVKYINKVIYKYRKGSNKRIKRKEGYPHPINLLFVPYI